MDVCDTINTLAERNKREALAMKTETLLKEDVDKLLDLWEGLDAKSVVNTVDDIIDVYVEGILADGRAKAAIDAAAFNVSEEYLGTAEEYLALKTLATNRSDLNTAVAEYMSKEMATNVNLKFRTGGTISKTKTAIRNLFAKQLKARLNDSKAILKAAGASLVDDKDAYAEIKQLLEDMKVPLDNENVINYYDDEGKLVTAEVNPNLADFWNYTPISAPTKYELFFGNALFRGMNRLTRTLQTTLSTISYKNQWSRDWMNNFLGSGAYQGLKSMSNTAASLYSGAVAEWVKENEPERYKDLLEVANKSGKPVEEVIWESEEARGFAGISGQTPTEYYRTPVRKGFNDDVATTNNLFEKAWDKILYLPEKASQAREVWNRKRAYEKAYSDALAQGKSVDEARRWGEVARNNSTTNFWRGLKHFQMFQKTVNYFGAGVNGFKSFWKMFSLDPVGVSCRFFGGLVVPVVVATGLMLSNDEDRKKYTSLKEYEKRNQFIFMVNGEMYKIPIPQELGAIVDMVRHTTENLYDANNSEFWKLMMNDLLGIGPVDFSEFMLIDWDDFTHEPDLFDRVGGLGRSLIDQVAPPVIKSAVELATGIDTYTGQRIDDSYYIFDEEGNHILVGGTQREFALTLGKATNFSPAIIAHVTETFLADTGADFLDAIASGFNFSKMAENAIGGLFNYSVNDYDRLNSDWKRTLSGLWAEKEALLPAYNDYNEQISDTRKTAEERDKFRAKQKDLIDPFMNKVKNAVATLKAKDPNGYDRYRFAAVVSLLTFSTGTTSGATAEARQRALENFYENRAQAYQWMTELGINASSDASILGYVTTDANGLPTVKYNTPAQILAMREAVYGRGDRDVAELEVLVENGPSNLKKEIQEVYDQRRAIWGNKSKLSNSDYDQLDALYINWNSRVASAIRPYLERMTPEEVLSNDAVMEYLRDLFFAPGDYAVNDSGRHPSLGSRGNTKDAYIVSYIKSLYGVK